MSAVLGVGISKEEMCRALEAGYSFHVEELLFEWPLPPAAPTGRPPLFAKYDFAQLNPESAQVLASFPEWLQRLEATLDEYRMRQQRRDPEEWGKVLAAISSSDWMVLWSKHPAAAQIAREFNSLVAAGLILPETGPDSFPTIYPQFNVKIAELMFQELTARGKVLIGRLPIKMQNGTVSHYETYSAVDSAACDPNDGPGDTCEVPLEMVARDAEASYALFEILRFMKADT